MRKMPDKSRNDQLISAAKRGQLGKVCICINSKADIDYTPQSKNQWTALHHAVYRNRKKVVKYLLENGANQKTSSEQTKYKSLLTLSIHHKNWHVAKLLIDAGADLNVGTPPPLIEAVRKKNLDIVKLLTSKGANIDVVYNKMTPLTEAMGRKYTDISKFLINFGADVNKDFEQTLVDYAVKYNLKDILTLLIEKNASVGSDSLMFCIRKKNIHMMKFLVKKGANVNKLDKKGETPLSYAVRTKKMEIVKWLLENGAEFSVHSALDCAIDTENMDMVKMLIQKGSEVNLQQGNINTPLVKAIRLKNYKIVRELIRNGADVNLASLGVLPLIEAIESEQIKTANYLLDQGADPNLSDGKGNLPLIKAIEMRQLEIVNKLVEKEVDINSSDGNGKTPLVRALEVGDEQITRTLLEQERNLVSNPTLLINYVQNKNLKVVELLLEDSTDLLDGVGDCGYTPLTKSAQMDDFNMLKFLVEKGANVNQVDGNSNTALFLGASKRNFQMVDYLLKHEASVHMEKAKLKKIAKTDDDFAVYWERALQNEPEQENDIFAISYEECDEERESETGNEQNEENVISNSALIIKYVQDQNFKKAELLLKDNTDLLNAVGDCGYTPLTKSVQMGDFSMVEFFVRKGANVNEVDGNNNTALVLAASKRSFRMIEYLLSHGADVHVKREKLDEIAKRDEDFAYYLKRALKNKPKEKQDSSEIVPEAEESKPLPENSSTAN